jgi:hypothetical protein
MDPVRSFCQFPGHITSWIGGRRPVVAGPIWPFSGEGLHGQPENPIGGVETQPMTACRSQSEVLYLDVFICIQLAAASQGRNGVFTPTLQPPICLDAWEGINSVLVASRFFATARYTAWRLSP